RVWRLGLSGELKTDPRGVTQGRHSKRLAAALVTGQMMLAIVLLSGAGVLVRSFATIVGGDTGVRNPENVLIGFLRLPSEKYPTPAARQAYFDQVESRLRAIAGVERAAMATTVPVKWV